MISSFDSFETVHRAVLLTDLIDSTLHNAKVGDLAFATVLATLESSVRQLIRRYNGREIDKTDGFLISFEEPLNCLLFALDLNERIIDISNSVNLPLKLRTGLHYGVLIQRANSAQDVAAGAKTIELDGLTKVIASRIMDLAEAGQILVTRTIFDMMRENEQLVERLGSNTTWLAHGSYLLYGLSDAVEIFEVGRPGFSPLTTPTDKNKARRAILPQDEFALGWRPATGQFISSAEAWRLIRKLGEGGYGEVWLAQRPDTRELRVYKFCFEPTRIRGLKREKVLLELIQEKLGNRNDIAKILDWNMSQAPYFIALEYIPLDNLSTWMDKRSKEHALPEVTVLTIVKQAAQAVQAAHSVGILHKDIKPSNLLIGGKDPEPHVHLIDFGIGLYVPENLNSVVRDDEFLYAAGQTTLHTSSLSGSRMYIAPEVLEGREPTVQADLYPLGVLLYQLIRGDMETGLNVGWDRDIQDPVLMQLISDATDGDLRKRLKSAEELVTHIESLQARRDEVARLEDKRLQQLRELERKNRRRRLGSYVLFIGTIAPLAGTIYYQRSLTLAAEKQKTANEKRAVSAYNHMHDLSIIILEDIVPHIQQDGAISLLDKTTSAVLQFYNTEPIRSISSQATVRGLADVFLQQGRVALANFRRTDAKVFFEKALLQIDGLTSEGPRETALKADAMYGIIESGFYETSEDPLNKQMSVLSLRENYLKSGGASATDIWRYLENAGDVAVRWRGETGWQMMTKYGKLAEAAAANLDSPSDQQAIEAFQRFQFSRATLLDDERTSHSGDELLDLYDAVLASGMRADFKHGLLTACAFYGREHLQRNVSLALSCLSRADGIVDISNVDMDDRRTLSLIAKIHALTAKAFAGTHDIAKSQEHAQAAVAILDEIIIADPRNYSLWFDYWESSLQNQMALAMLDDRHRYHEALNENVTILKKVIDSYPEFYFFMKNLLFASLELALETGNPEELKKQLSFLDQHLSTYNLSPGAVTEDIIKCYRIVAAEPLVFNKTAVTWASNAGESAANPALAILNKTSEVYIFKLYKPQANLPFLSRIIMSNRERDFTHTVMEFCPLNCGIQINNGPVVPLVDTGSFNSATNRFEINMSDFISRFGDGFTYQLNFSKSD